MSISQIAKHLKVSRQAVSRHIQTLLSDGHLKVKERRGNLIIYEPGIHYSHPLRTKRNPNQKGTRSRTMVGCLLGDICRPHDLTANYPVQGYPQVEMPAFTQHSWGSNKFGFLQLIPPKNQKYIPILIRKGIKVNVISIRYFPKKKGGTLRVELYQEPLPENDVEEMQRDLLRRFRDVGHWFKNSSRVAMVGEPIINERWHLAYVEERPDSTLKAAADLRLEADDGSANYDNSTVAAELEYKTWDSRQKALNLNEILNGLFTVTKTLTSDVSALKTDRDLILDVLRQVVDNQVIQTKAVHEIKDLIESSNQVTDVSIAQILELLLLKNDINKPLKGKNTEPETETLNDDDIMYC